jgi:hypothetical protein
MPSEFEEDYDLDAYPRSPIAPLGSEAFMVPAGECVVCLQPLGIPGGMGGTGLCGPCCTGEAATLEERGETW